MKKTSLNFTILMLCWLLSVVNISAQQSELDARQNLSQIKIEHFDWYLQPETAEPKAFKNYYRRGAPQGETTNFPSENSSAQNESEKFIYRIRIRNLSDKEITSIVWRYEFFDPLTKKAAQSLEFESRVRIKPGKRKTIYVESFSPPAQTINVNLLFLNAKQPFLESTAVKSVVFKEISERQRLVAKN
ncbi:MAG TPA: hypothetical protein VK400_07740 [Pyrinomonadaceae bacterium]|nr:hypothetical protein [Pyrinomonadaceae bacterium]